MMLKELKLQAISEAYDSAHIGLYNPSSRLQRQPKAQCDVTPLGQIRHFEQCDEISFDVVVSFEENISEENRLKLEQIADEKVIEL